MNLGKRIEHRLKELGWERKALYDAIPELTPQALSNLIKRDSKRSEWDTQIAHALHVSVLWLVYGDETPYRNSGPASELQANEPATVHEFHSPQTSAVVKIMASLNPERQNEVLAFAEERQLLQAASSQNSIPRAGQ